MADSFTPNVNLRMPEVGHANDTWGGTAGLNSDLSILDSVFQANGLSTVGPVTGPLSGVPGVGLRVGLGYTLNVEGTALFKDHTDITKVAQFDSSLISTGTTRTFQFPDENGVLATQVDVAIRCPTGTVLSGYYGAAPPGFVMADGRTIGDATSGATNRANADTVGLFTVFWSLGFTPSGGRGASAAADFAAHKTMALPNHSGRTMAGRDDLSGTAAGIWPGATVRGAAGGEATHVLSVGELATHSHSDTGHSHGMLGNYLNINAVGAFATNAGTTGSIWQGTATGTSYAALSNTGSSAGHNNMQPTIVVDVIIAL